MSGLLHDHEKYERVYMICKVDLCAKKFSSIQIETRKIEGEIILYIDLIKINTNMF